MSGNSAGDGRDFNQMKSGPSVRTAAATRAAVPAAPATTHDLGDAAGMIGGLSDRLAISRSRRSAADADQAHARRYDYCKCEIAHADSSLCMTPGICHRIFSP
jgi:hypothetical protein